jgi:hypothetical protein
MHNSWWMHHELAGTGKMPSLKAVIHHQLEFVRAYREIVDWTSNREEALRTMAICCLA